MIRTLPVLTIFLVGCASGPEPLPPTPLPPIATTDSVRDLLARARLQATNATEAYFLDDWSRLDSTGQMIADTATRLREVPVSPEREAELRAAANRLATHAQALREAAIKKDTDSVNAILPKLGSEVRTMQATFGAVITEIPPKPALGS